MFDFSAFEGNHLYQNTITIPTIWLPLLLMLLTFILTLIGYLIIRIVKNRFESLKEDCSEKERRYRTLVENSPDLIVRYDTEARRLFVNKTYQRVTGIPSEHLVGKNYIGLLNSNWYCSTGFDG
jgi:PAS domain-containing protein